MILMRKCLLLLILSIPSFLFAQHLSSADKKLVKDLKNHIEALESRHFDPHFFPELICWTPSYVIRLSESGELLFEKGVLSPEVFDFATSWFFPSKNEDVKLQFIPDINKFDYIGRVLKIQHEIQRGNCYELNFCQNFTAKDIDLI